MKLITAIVNKEDSKNVCNQLLKNKFYVTRLATTGGFLMAGNMTLLICTEDEKVDDCIGIIPFKMKYLGWYELFVWVVQFLMGSLTTKISLVLSLLGFLVFFGREVFDWCRDTLTGYKRRRDWENRNR